MAGNQICILCHRRMRISTIGYSIESDSLPWVNTGNQILYYELQQGRESYSVLWDNNRKSDSGLWTIAWNHILYSSRKLDCVLLVILFCTVGYSSKTDSYCKQLQEIRLSTFFFLLSLVDQKSFFVFSPICGHSDDSLQ
jgi:hypothetical protein